MFFFLRNKKSISSLLILAVLFSVSPFFVTKVQAIAPGPALNTSEATPIAGAGASLLGACVPLATGNGFVCDPSVRYNTYQILLSTLGIGPGVAQRQTYWNSIFYFAMRILLREVTMSIVNWINTGFQGNPSFIQDPKDFLQKDADRVIGNFIQSSDLNFLCEPFKINVKLSLGLQYSPFRDTIGCRLTDVLANSKEAYNDFLNGDFIGGGGWESWLSVTTVPQNNQMGAMLIAQSELDARINEKSVLSKDELSWGNGILSMKNCTRTTKDENGKTISSQVYNGDPYYQLFLNNPVKNPIGTNLGTSTRYTSSNDFETGAIGTVEENCKISTPGVMISDYAKTTWHWDTDALNMADDLNEIVGALGNFVITKVINKGYALINKDELSPNEASWRDGIKQMQAQIGNDANIINKNPNYEPEPAIYTMDNGGIINNPNEQGYYVDPAETLALEQEKKNLLNSISFYQTPEESYYSAFNSIYQKSDSVITKSRETVACYNTKLNSATINPPLDSEERNAAQNVLAIASTTISEMKNIQDSTAPNLIRSSNNLGSLQNIASAVNSANKIDQLDKPKSNLNIIIPQLHVWDSMTQQTASTTASQLDEEIVSANSLKTQCDVFPER